MFTIIKNSSLNGSQSLYVNMLNADYSEVINRLKEGITEQMYIVYIYNNNFEVTERPKLLTYQEREVNVIGKNWYSITFYTTPEGYKYFSDSYRCNSDFVKRLGVHIKLSYQISNSIHNDPIVTEMLSVVKSFINADIKLFYDVVNCVNDNLIIGAWKYITDTIYNSDIYAFGNCRNEIDKMLKESSNNPERYLLKLIDFNKNFDYSKILDYVKNHYNEDENVFVNDEGYEYDAIDLAYTFNEQQEVTDVIPIFNNCFCGYPVKLQCSHWIAFKRIFKAYFREFELDLDELHGRFENALNPSQHIRGGSYSNFLRVDY